MLTDEQRLIVLRMARDAVVAQVTGARHRPAPQVTALPLCCGAFVTIHARGDLRGCIGHVETNRPIEQLIPGCASAACSADPRFPPVTVPELPHLLIEVSVLGPLEPVWAPEEIVIGRHGLVVEDGEGGAAGLRRGLLLPQVASERKWDRERFLAETCRKAGLPRDAWRTGARVLRFEAEVFSE